MKKKEELNIMANIKIIEELKANLLCIIGEFFSLLTRGTNVAKDSKIGRASCRERVFRAV